MSGHRVISVPDWYAPRGYSNGILAAPGRLLFVAGQVPWDVHQRLVGGEDFALQFDRALANVLEVVAAAGGKPEDLTRLTIYVSDTRRYLESSRRLGELYRARMGRHYPAMCLVEVAALLEPGALVEIEATAVIPESRS
jgi:enamine deaminase RidA (YjgF/YER057c/UK114 family)